MGNGREAAFPPQPVLGFSSLEKQFVKFFALFGVDLFAQVIHFDTGSFLTLNFEH